MGYIIGATLTTAVAVPLAAALDGWRGAVGVAAAGAFASLAGWWLLAPHDGHGRRVAPRRPALPWRRPIAWLIGVAFGLQSTLFYGAVSWLATMYGERGWSPNDAANLTALFTGLGIVSTVAAPLFAVRVGSRRLQLSVAATMSLVGAIGVAAGTGTSDPFAVPSVGLLGLGLGLFFPLCLTLPLDAARSAAEASSLAALMLLVGYLIAAAAPVVLGAIRDAAGDFAIVGWVLVATAAALLVTALSLTERRLRTAEATPQ
jgi:CP family cyanate transporter-like MFS transporter